MKYEGSCHCGRVAFEVEGEIEGAFDCNCSMCRRKGSILWAVPRDSFRLTTPEADVSYYTFYKHNIQHAFCANCGIGVYGQADHPKMGPMAAVNLRCIPAVDLDAVAVTHVDGASF